MLVELILLAVAAQIIKLRNHLMAVFIFKTFSNLFRSCHKVCCPRSGYCQKFFSLDLHCSSIFVLNRQPLQNQRICQRINQWLKKFFFWDQKCNVIAISNVLRKKYRSQNLLGFTAISHSWLGLRAHHEWSRSFW